MDKKFSAKQMQELLSKKRTEVIYAARNGKVRYTASVYFIPEVGYEVISKQVCKGQPIVLYKPRYYWDRHLALLYARCWIRDRVPRWRGYIQGPLL